MDIHSQTKALYPRPAGIEDPKIIPCTTCEGSGYSPEPEIFYDEDNNQHEKPVSCTNCRGHKRLWFYTKKAPETAKAALEYFPDHEGAVASEKYRARQEDCVFEICMALIILSGSPGIFFHFFSETIGFVSLGVIAVMMCLAPVLSSVYKRKSRKAFENHGLEFTYHVTAPARSERAPSKNEWKWNTVVTQKESLLASEPKQQLQQSA